LRDRVAWLAFPVHVHMLRHSTGYALAARGMDTRRLQHFLGHASITNTVRYTAMSQGYLALIKTGRCFTV
jgi:site-specific recombinase XerD